MAEHHLAFSCFAIYPDDGVLIVILHKSVQKQRRAVNNFGLAGTYGIGREGAFNCFAIGFDIVVGVDCLRNAKLHLDTMRQLYLFKVEGQNGDVIRHGVVYFPFYILRLDGVFRKNQKKQLRTGKLFGDGFRPFVRGQDALVIPDIAADTLQPVNQALNPSLILM